MGMKFLKTYENLIKLDIDDLTKTKEFTLDDVFNDCKQYINLIKKCTQDNLGNYTNKKKLLVRGVQNMNINIDKCNKIVNRIPKDIPIDIHNKINEILEKEFGWKVRNGLFCFFRTEDMLVSGYGSETYLLFPIGDFDYCWNPEIYDLWGDFEDAVDTWQQIEDGHEDDVDDYYMTLLDNLKDELDNYIDNNICKVGLQEVSINCKSYYLIHKRHKDEIIEKIWG